MNADRKESKEFKCVLRTALKDAKDFYLEKQAIKGFDKIH